VTRTLPSWLGLGSDDIVLSLDYPAPVAVLDEVDRIAEAYGFSNSIRIVETRRDDSWRFHQAHARRMGFESAKHDSILTGDIDLLVRRPVSGLTQLVGPGKAGLASCLRVPAPTSALQVFRAWSYTLKQAVLPPIFSGLYAFWRPFWLETEDEGIKRLRNPARETYKDSGPGLVGEDTYLFICMRRAYPCICLQQIGAVSLNRNVEDLPPEQYSWGRYLASIHTPWPAAALASVAFAYPFLMMGYLHQRRNPISVSDPFSGRFRL
jgi:hypothetical protein